MKVESRKMKNENNETSKKRKTVIEEKVVCDKTNWNTKKRKMTNVKRRATQRQGERQP